MPDRCHHNHHRFSSPLPLRDVFHRPHQSAKRNRPPRPAAASWQPSSPCQPSASPRRSRRALRRTSGRRRTSSSRRSGTLGTCWWLLPLLVLSLSPLQRAVRNGQRCSMYIHHFSRFPAFLCSGPLGFARDVPGTCTNIAGIFVYLRTSTQQPCSGQVFAATCYPDSCPDS